MADMAWWRSRATRDDLSVHASARERLAIVGAGMSAQRLLDRLVGLGAARHYEITVLSEEDYAPYDRVHLGSVIEGAPSESLTLRPDAWYREHGIRLELKQKVVRLDRARRVVETDSGGEIPYDRLVLATGSSAFVPDIPGLDDPAVVLYRTRNDVERIAREVARGIRVTVVGGGLLGLEAAHAALQRGCEVGVVEVAPRLLPRQLDASGASLLADQAREAGLRLHIHRRVLAVRRNADSLEIELDDGTRLTSELIILASGIRPQDAMARDAGIDCNPAGGIIVDDRLTTSDPAVSAIGECARFGDSIGGFVAPCYGMAETLASVLTGRDATYTPPTPSARLKVPGLSVTTVGESLAERPGVRGLTWSNEAAYRRVVLDHGRVAGAITLGEGGDPARLQEAIARSAKVRAWQERRFATTGALWKESSAPGIERWRDDAVVCSCTGVTCGTLREARAGGARTSQALRECTGAATTCGSCLPLVEEIAGERTAAAPTASGGRLAAVAAAGLVVLGGALLFGPIPMTESVRETPAVDFLWRDTYWKQVSGFTLLGLCALSLVFSLRKRISRFTFGSFGHWRFAHTALGAATIVGVGVHTGMRLGTNLNFALMMSFLGVVVLGSLTALVVSLEHRLPAPYGGALRRSWAAAHVIVFWPMPILVLFHVLAVYVY